MEHSKIISEAEALFGDILIEYAHQSDASEEDMCSGAWEPTVEQAADAMHEAVYAVARDMDSKERMRLVDKWMTENYG